MDTLQLQRILTNHLHQTYVGVYAEDELPEIQKRPVAMIVNTDPSTEDGTHWTAIYLTPGHHGEFFDSFGQPPDVPVRRYLDHAARNGWKYNIRKVQGLYSTLCGAYCVQYLDARQTTKLPFSSLLYKLFPDKNNDILVKQRMLENYHTNLEIFDTKFYREQYRNRTL